MSNLVGRVHFNATIDGKNMPRDAERVGMQAGRQGAKGFNEEWDKEFSRGLTAQGKRQLDHWKKRGSTDGLAYGRGLEIEVTKFANRLNSAFDNFQGLNVDSTFMDTWVDKSRDWDAQINELRGSLALLQRQGSITDRQFENSTRIIDDWADAQRGAAEFKRNLVRLEQIHAGNIADTNREWEHSTSLSNRLLDSFGRLHVETKSLSEAWGGMSHNARQWTLIIGAVTAALPELAGLSSAAGSGLYVLAGGATAAAVGVGTTISAIVGLSKDVKKLPADVLAAREGFDDFRDSFSALNNEIISAAFADSEEAWRSLGETVRGLSPAFSEVGGVVGTLLDDLSRNLAPGTKNFENLSKLIANSAPLYDQLLRSVGRLGEGLLSSFSNPEMLRSMQEMLGWIDELTDGFADFLEGDSFDDWLRHGRAVFGEFGELLETTGGLLNDLVTPESINRLTTFMDNIGVFLDTGGRGILEFADELNIFGVLAEALADVGTALEPLRDPMADLAEALSGAVIPAVEGFSAVVGGLATVVAPAATAVGDLLGAVPPQAWQVLGGGLAYVGAGLLTLKGIGDLAGLVNGMRGISVEGGKAVGALGRVGRAAGLAGAAVIGIGAAAEGLEQLYRAFNDIDDIARNAVSSGQSLADSYEELGVSASGASYGLTDISGALDQLATVGTGIEDFFPTLLATFSDTGRQASQLAATLDELDEPLAQLANTSVSAASDKFRAWTEELNATDAQVMNMLNSMPEFKSVIEQVALQERGAATDADLLSVALGRGKSAVDNSTGALEGLAGQAELTRDQVDELADTIRGFGETNLSARDAEREFQQAIDDLSASVDTNGTSLDINTQKGRDNQAALDKIAEAALEASAATLERTGSEDDATAAVKRGRDELIKQLEQFGITGQAAEDYADELGLVPDEVSSEAEFIAEPAKRQVKAWKDLLASIPRSIVTTPRLQGTGGTAPDATATGGIFHSEQVRRIGEAGSEAVVPLNRALNQVDPSVRWLSAVAQGKIPFAEGGGSGMVVESGAIVVQDHSGNPVQTAHEVLTRFIERVAS